MRYLLFIMPLLFVSLPLLAQQQYSDGACILLQQQIDRFSQQRQNSNYRNAKREYDRYCQQPVQAAPRTTQAQQAVPVAPPKEMKELKQAGKEQATQPEALTTAVKPEPATQPQTDAAQTDTTQTDKAEPAKTQVNPADLTAEKVSASPQATAGDSNTVQPQAEADAPVDAVPDSVPAPQHVTAPQDDIMMLVLNSIPLVAANIVALLLVIFLLTSWLGYNLPGFKGVFAEYKLNQLLRWRLSKQYQHFRKLKLYTAKDELTEIDHLVLCPYGIFVIKVRSDRGRISGNETAANWRRHYFARDKQLMNPLHQNFKNVEAVKHLLQLLGKESAQAVYSVVVFNRVAQFASTMPSNVMYVDAAAAYLKQFTEVVLSDEQVSRFAAVLKQASTA